MKKPAKTSSKLEPATYNPDAPRIGFGVYTLDDIAKRCAIDDDTGCWHWRMAISDGGKTGSSRTPRLSMPVGVMGNVNRTMSVARVVWIMQGRPLRRGWVVWRTCRNDDCCAPEHLKAGTKANEGAWARADGRLRGDPTRAAINLRTLASTQAVPREIVEAIANRLAAGELGKALAAAYGINKATVSRIKKNNHLHQRAGVIGSSIFSFRPS